MGDNNGLVCQVMAQMMRGQTPMGPTAPGSMGGGVGAGPGSGPGPGGVPQQGFGGGPGPGPVRAFHPRGGPRGGPRPFIPHHERPCREILASGTCSFGDRCRFKHDIPNAPQPGAGPGHFDDDRRGRCIPKHPPTNRSAITC